jgi:hypothetical protein
MTSYCMKLAKYIFIIDLLVVQFVVASVVVSVPYHVFLLIIDVYVVHRYHLSLDVVVFLNVINLQLQIIYITMVHENKKKRVNCWICCMISHSHSIPSTTHIM